MDLSQEIVGGSVALFVDGDNLGPALAGPILRAASLLGRVSVRRVYARAEGLRAWDGCTGYRMVHAGGAKNGTDLLLCIEAVEMACRGGIAAFVIASDDRDFTHLAHWLRERGFRVHGLGTAKSPDDWRAACEAFEELGPAMASPASGNSKPAAKPAVVRPVPAGAPATQTAGITATDAKIKALILAEGQGRSMPIGTFGARMGSVHSVRPTDLAHGDWRSYLASRPTLYALDARGPTACVRWVGAT